MQPKGEKCNNDKILRHKYIKDFYLTINEYSIIYIYDFQSYFNI